MTKDTLVEHALRILEETPVDERRIRAQGMADILRYLASSTIAQRWLWDDIRVRFEAAVGTFLEGKDSES